MNKMNTKYSLLKTPKGIISVDPKGVVINNTIRNIDPIQCVGFSTTKSLSAVKNKQRSFHSGEFRYENNYAILSIEDGYTTMKVDHIQYPLFSAEDELFKILDDYLGTSSDMLLELETTLEALPRVNEKIADIKNFFKYFSGLFSILENNPTGRYKIITSRHKIEEKIIYISFDIDVLDETSHRIEACEIKITQVSKDAYKNVVDILKESQPNWKNLTIVDQDAILDMELQDIKTLLVQGSKVIVRGVPLYDPPLFDMLIREEAILKISKNSYKENLTILNRDLSY